MSNLYGTEIEIWAGFGPVGSTEKNLEPVIGNFGGQSFHVTKFVLNFFKSILASELKKCIK